MSEESANIVVNTGDLVEFTFTPQTDGLAELSVGTVTPDATDVGPDMTVTPTTASIVTPPGAPAGDSIVQLILVLGPTLETGSLTYSVNGAAPVDYYVDFPLSQPILQINLYGK